MSRLAVMSDIHANLHALRAVVAELSLLKVDSYLCAGDIVGYGAHPNECIEVLNELPSLVVAGNHDLVASGRADLARCGRLARQTLEWTVEQLNDASGRYLESLPGIYAEGVIAMTHGSLTDPFEYVRSAALAASQLDQLASTHPDARLLLLGHTHLPMAFATKEGMLDTQRGPVRLLPGQRYVLNPGSVGQSRDRSPEAAFLVLDLTAGQAEFRRVPYDIAACRRDLRSRGLPEEACHRVPVSNGFVRRSGRRAKRLVRAGRARLAAIRPSQE